jgi:hypothetical protein
MRHHTGQSGYVALLAVLIVGAASIAVGSSLLLTSADNQRMTLAAQRSMQARNHAVACAEEALQQIHDNTAFTGSNNLVLPTGSCQYSVTNTGGNNRTVTAYSTVGPSVRRIQITLTIGVSNITINTWQEIP